MDLAWGTQIDHQKLSKFTVTVKLFQLNYVRIPESKSQRPWVFPDFFPPLPAWLTSASDRRSIDVWLVSLLIAIYRFPLVRSERVGLSRRLGAPWKFLFPHHRHSNLGMERRQTKLPKVRRRSRKDHIERRESVHLRAPPQAEKSNPIWCMAWSSS